MEVRCNVEPAIADLLAPIADVGNRSAPIDKVPDFVERCAPDQKLNFSRFARLEHGIRQVALPIDNCWISTRDRVDDQLDSKDLALPTGYHLPVERRRDHVCRRSAAPRRLRGAIEGRVRSASLRGSLPRWPGRHRLFQSSRSNDLIFGAARLLARSGHPHSCACHYSHRVSGISQAPSLPYAPLNRRPASRTNRRTFAGTDHTPTADDRLNEVRLGPAGRGVEDEGPGADSRSRGPGRAVHARVGARALGGHRYPAGVIDTLVSTSLTVPKLYVD